MLKHGDIDYSTGLVFWSKTRGREIWMDPARYFFRKNTAHRNARSRYALNLEENRTRVREYGRAHKDMKHASFKKWADRNKERIRNGRLKRTYGISTDDYIKMWKQQDGKCAICESRESAIRKESGVSYDLCVDHCHKTGKVRKLLCQSCNTGIGQLKDNPDLMLKAAKYINEHLQS